MNINNLLIKTKIVEFYWIPLLFGLYNVFDCLHKLNNYYKKKITKLQVLLNDTNKKHNELQQKYNQLYAEFQELNLKFNKLNSKEINEFTIETETNIVYRDLCEHNSSNSLSIDQSINPFIDPSNILSINDIVISPLNNNNDITSEFIDSLSLDYNYNETYFDNNKNTSNLNINTNLNTNTNSNSNSNPNPNPNWSTVTKRFFFG